MSFLNESRNTRLNKAVDNLLAEMDGREGEPEYSTMVDQLETLVKLKAHDKPWWLPSGDAAGTIIANFGIAAIVLYHEREHVVTTKLWNFLAKAK